jgi:hypothetical protein
MKNTVQEQAKKLVEQVKLQAAKKLSEKGPGYLGMRQGQREGIPSLYSACWEFETDDGEDGADPKYAIELAGGLDLAQDDEPAKAEMIQWLRDGITQVNSGAYQFFAITSIGGLYGGRVFGLYRGDLEKADTGDYQTEYASKEEALAELEGQLQDIQSGAVWNGGEAPNTTGLSPSTQRLRANIKPAQHTPLTPAQTAAGIRHARPGSRPGTVSND